MELSRELFRKRNFIQATTRHLTPRGEVLPVLRLESIKNYSNTFKMIKNIKCFDIVVLMRHMYIYLYIFLLISPIC